jgi:hypothetical protein
VAVDNNAGANGSLGSVSGVAANGEVFTRDKEWTVSAGGSS